LKTTKMISAVLAVFLIAALFTCAASAVPAAGSTVYVYEYGATGDVVPTTYYHYENGMVTGSAITDATGTFVSEGIVAGTYDSVATGLTAGAFILKYPALTLDAFKTGTGTSIVGTSVLKSQKIDLSVSGTNGITYGFTFTTPAGGKTNEFGKDAVTGIVLTFADSTVFPAAQLNNIDISSVATGEWTAIYELKTGAVATRMTATTPSKYLKSPAIKFTVGSAVTESISINKEKITRGGSILVTITGTPGAAVRVNVDNLGFVDLAGQSGIRLQAYDVTGYITAFTADLSSSGTRTLQFDSNTLATPAEYTTYTFTAKMNPDENVTVTIINGEVTAESDQKSYYIGNLIKLSGINTESKNIYLYIKGTNVQQTYLTNVSVNADCTWTKTFDPGIYRSLDAGTYTIYAAASAGPAPGYSFDANSVYATTSISLKQPFLSATAGSSVVAQGGKIQISGTAEGTNRVMYYVFGTNRFESSNTSVNNEGSYSIQIDTDTYSAGQYFVVVQHPMYDRVFNIGPVAAQYGGYDLKINAQGDYTSEDATILFNTNERQSANAAEALGQALDTQNIDDIYVKLIFIVAQPTLTMNPVSDIVKGQSLTVSGTTNLKEGTVITVDILSTAFTAVDKSILNSIVSSSSFLTQTTTVLKGADGVNTWEAIFDTTGLNADTYTIQATAESQMTSVVIMIHGEDNITSPTPTPVVLTSGFVLQSVNVDPEYSPDVTEGTPISVQARLLIAKDAITTSGSLKLSTDLRQSTAWTVDVYKGTTVYNSTSDALITSLSSTSFSYTISGFVLDYDQPVTLVINLTGLYPAASGNITAFKLDCDTGYGYGQDFTYSYLYGPTTPTPTPVPSFDNDLELQSGWNFISVPKTLNASKNTAGSLFGSVETNNKNILAYNAQTRTWVPILNQNEIIQPLNGYWIYSANQTTITLTYPSTPTTPSMKTLYPGWNAIGLSSAEPASARSALAGTSWRTLIPWNLADGSYDAAIVNGGSEANSPDRLMTPGNGYWVYVDTQSTMTGLTA